MSDVINLDMVSVLDADIFKYAAELSKIQTFLLYEYS